jgi:hypothetical protein
MEAAKLSIKVTMMKPLLFLAIALGGAGFFSASLAHPPRGREQDQAFHGTREGRFMPLRAIEARVAAHMPGFVYLGPELDAGAGRYRLKFMKGPNVIWIDVDARTGEILARSGY